MFKRYGINITKTKLREFFKRIDQDEDDKLNWNDFRQALQNQEALQMFVELMRKIRETSEKLGKPNEFNFVPLSFPNMIQYMNYCVLREELIQKIKSEQLSNQQKVKQCTNLLSLEDICYKKVLDMREVEEEQQQDEEDPLKKFMKKNNDPQQLAILKRLQEKEQMMQRQKRIRKLSSSQYYRTDTDQTNRSIRKSYQSNKQETSKIYQSEFKLIDQFVNDNQSQLPFKITDNKNNLNIQQALQITERLNLNNTDSPYKYQANHLKQVSCTTSTRRGDHFTNQYLINSKSPFLTSQISKLRSPQRIRVISQIDLKKSDSKNKI
ncbi:unnamed protein product (macronuclear) [Paramecium tetraurelia]|uniref:EF-hand domain-containing protein n=1 Tax=Paramecium tetraurelia TaxID=5888 RepID=A0DVP3_PARTE|nr:uncharacterized protein GSPATT00020763001 [Paramecium tetraurelia]CAK87110.1 unnamed protein product [Paramecium tetraurelia]|eukprot:XP_001454507.1 hypothetical protein (macronuclear) [Paramecium tetraurelia strain d4-2]